MRIKTSIFICVISVVVSIQASTNVFIGSTEYALDTLYHATVGPGITETHLTMYADNYKANIFIAKIDVTNPHNDIRVLTAGDTVFGLCNIPQLALSNDNNEIKHIAGINADFAQIGNYKVPPAGYVVSDGNYIGAGGGNYASDFSSYFYYKDNYSGFARNVQITATIQMPAGTQLNAYVNKRRDENDIILYNRRYGKFTGTNIWGGEVMLRVKDGRNEFTSDSLTILKVVSDIDTAGNMAIPDDGYVLSCHGTSIAILRQLKVGDMIKISPKVIVDGIETSLPKQLVGGSPIMLKGGVVDSARIDDADKYLGHLNNREPRTAIGISENRDSVYFVVVDGRVPGISDGIKVKELAHLMRFIGCHDAMNCDGGGSSQFYVKGLYGPNGCRVRNNPVGGTYCRPVSNGIFAVTKTPDDDVITRIEIREKKLNLSTGDEYIPVVYGFNKYGVIVNYNIKDVKITVAPEVGIAADGRFIAGSGKYNTDFTVTYRGISHSVPMYINGGGIFISGIEELTDDCYLLESEYYTIQGIKVNNPQRGQFVIVRRGTQFSKEFYYK